MSNFHTDYETFSPQSLKDVGVHRYIADPEAEPLMLAIAKDDEEPCILLPGEFYNRLETALGCMHPARTKLWDDYGKASVWLRDASLPGNLMWAHNVSFEQAVTRWKPTIFDGVTARAPGMDQWRCTMTLAMRAGLPPALEDLAETLKLEQKKDKEGTRLINLFSKPRTAGKRKGERVYPWDQPEEFLKFMDYCRQDVRTEQAIHRKLAPFELKGFLLDAFLFDLRMNNRGVPVNVDKLREAQRLVRQTQEEKGAEFKKITGLQPSQREKCLRWFTDRGYKEPDMTALSVKRALRDTSWASPEVLEAFRIRQELSYAACAKIDTMLDCQVGGKVYGTHRFHGASTGRWAGRLIQPQNFKRPTVKFTELFYKTLNADTTCGDTEIGFGSVLDVVSSSIRHFIDAGEPLLDADYSGIEARLVCWLADQEDSLEEFRKGVDKYRSMAEDIFGIPAKNIGKESNERWLGKQSILGCGYGMGWRKFKEYCELRAEIEGRELSLTKEDYKRIIKVYREKHAKVKQLWWDCDEAARAAILAPGRSFRAGSKLAFVCASFKDIPYLLLRLPSGRSLAYPWPEITPVRKQVLDEDGEPKTTEDGEYIYRDGTEVTYFGSNEETYAKGRIKIYGGKFVENATQGVAFDIMAHGALNAEQEGMEAFMLVHDELICRAGSKSSDDLVRAMTKLPPWGAGIPLAAEGKNIPFYKK